MPVVNPRPASGMLHSVSRTWQALKNLAAMFGKVNAVNQESPAAQRLFPRAFMAVTAASDNAPVKLDLSTAIRMAEAKGLRSSWAEVTPSSVLLLPFGQSTGAVADVMDVTYNEQADEISLELDVVHHPHTISEFDSHDKQTLDVEEAHYHFDTAPGVKVDAQALLQALQAPNAAVEGLHLFVKGSRFGDHPSPFPCTQFSLSTNLAANDAQAAVGSVVQVTVTATGFNADCLCEEVGCCSQQRGSSTNPGLCEYGCDNEDYIYFCCGNDACCLDANGEEQGECGGGDVPIDDQQAALSAKGGSKSRVAPPAAAKKPTKRTGQRRATPVSELLACLPVALALTGNAEWVATAVSDCTSLGFRQQGARQPSGDTTQVTIPNGGTAWLKVTGTGDISVSAVGVRDSFINFDDVNINADYLSAPVSITGITAGAAPGTVTHLKLHPAKNHKHCGDPATVLATAKDATGAPVANAKVTFSADGDCHIHNSHVERTTDANGVATYTFGSYEPCKASVVAASVGADGVPVLSEVSYVYFEEDHPHYAKERDYYGDKGEYYKGGHPRYAEERLS